ncbi:ankyrin [Thelephora ganbajun]|uniref:Ankyrin n=1 Tax=Thelephora ganbajun TaxID=370292 RepID=A0ACB6ZD71_THEGA|nr:ankyrin [Thelephora ganbajun]
MPQTPEAQAFISRIAALPKGVPVSLDEVLQPSLEDEAELRRLFATDTRNPRLSNPYVGLVDVFGAPADIRTTRARVVQNEFDLSEKYLMPLTEARRRKEGSPAMASSLEEFNQNWSIFSEGSLSLLDWNNVVAAGGSVLACLLPVPDANKVSKRTLRKYFHSTAFPTSDVDLFLYGLTPEQAEAKIIAVFQAVRDAIPWDCTCVRTKHSISIHCEYFQPPQYPYRCVQIVLRLYSSPSEILAGFDVDAPCCAFDGTRVWANPRAIVSMMRQANTADITRRSPSYEVRLSKYSFRDFEVYVPNLKREEIDPTIYERSIARVEGLARLIVLERLYDPGTREKYLNKRRKIRNRPEFHGSYRGKRTYKGDLKTNSPDDVLETSSYDVVSLHIPYGPGWHARRIEKLVYQTDLGMNSPFNPKNKNRQLHRHPAFFGDIQECMEDCCEYCPEPKNDEEKELQKGEDEKYIRGRIQFIQEDPGRQSISGSFNPIDDGEWAGQAYIEEAEKLCRVIISFDRLTVLRMIKEEVDINRRDHVGRTPLHLAVLTGASEIACDLIDAGARMTARLVDGRTALHLAAQLGLGHVIEKLLERSKLNKEKVEEEKATKEAEKGEMAADEDDPMGGISKDKEEDAKSEDIEDDDDDDYEVIDREEANEGAGAGANIPEDNEDEPDILDVDVPDWDFGLTPLGYAIVHGHLEAVDQLLVAGSDPLQPVKSNSHDIPITHPLSLTILTEDEDVASKIVERLIQAGAVSSTADRALMSVFLRIVTAEKHKLLSTLFRTDPKAKKLVGFPTIQNGTVIFPTTAAVANHDFVTLALLLAHGAKVMFKDEDLDLARSTSDDSWLNGDANRVIQTPVETAIHRYDPVIFLLAGLGASLDVGIKQSYAGSWTKKASLLDAVEAIIKNIDAELGSLEQSAGSGSMDVDNTNQPEWKTWLVKSNQAIKNFEKKRNQKQQDNMLISKRTRMKGYLEEVLALLKEKEAKTWNQIHPDIEKKTGDTDKQQKPAIPFHVWSSDWWAEPVQQEKVPFYEELYEACWNGDDDKIRELCLPSPEGTTRKVAPIQIVCKTTEGDYTPLYVAIHRRHWSTANTVLTIAAAQQKTKPEATITAAFNTLDIKLEESDAEETDDSGDNSDDREEPKFIDLDRQDARVRYDVGPDKLFKALTARLSDTEDGPVFNLNPLEGAIHDGDFEAFIQIIGLCAMLPKPVALTNLVTEDTFLRKDRAKFLDEYIRRTGRGIDVPQKTEGTEDAPQRPKGKEYWGLNVHGKKRRDLATRGDPNARYNSGSSIPLVWRAAQCGALSVLEYLNTDRPLAAYQYYLSANAKEAKNADLPALESSILELLGWCSNPSNETALNAAVQSGKLGPFEKLLELNPTLLRPYLHKRHSITGQNLLLLAVRYSCTNEFVDYLMKQQKISPTEYDLRSWNILHVAADRNDEQLLHLLEKIPREGVDSMLVQQSKPYLNTPLHLSVIKGNVDHVKALVALKTPALLLRDVNGFTPFHLAVKLGYSKIASLLVEVSPPEVLYMETVVGATVPETAVQRDLLSRAHTRLGNKCRPGGLSYGNTSVDSQYTPADSKELGERVETLKTTISQLQNERRLTKGTKVTKALIAFADNMMTKATEMKVKEVELEKETKDEEVKGDSKSPEKDDCDPGKTLAVVRKATQEKALMHRIPIQLGDVQKSVEAALPKRDVEQKAVKGHQDGSELGEEVDDSQVLPSQKWLGDYDTLEDLDGSRQ